MLPGLIVSAIPGTSFHFATDGRRLALLLPAGTNIRHGAPQGHHAKPVGQAWGFELREEYRR